MLQPPCMEQPCRRIIQGSDLEGENRMLGILLAVGFALALLLVYIGMRGWR